MFKDNIKKTFTIIGAQPGGNKGAEAMLTNLLNFLSDNFEVNKIYVELTSRDKLIQNYQNSYKDRFKNLTIDYFYFKPKKIFFSIKDEVLDVDCIIDISGISFHDGSIKANIRQLLKFIPIIIKKKKVIFFTQDIGPTNFKSTKYIASLVLKRVAKKIFPRSNYSKTNFEKLVSNRDIITEVYPDSAITLAKEEYSINLNHGESYIVIAPSTVVYNKIGDSYIKKLARIADFLSEKHKILLIAHDYTSKDHNDLKVSKLIYDGMSSNNKLLFGLNTKTEVYKYLISNSEFVITSRFHVVVAGLSTNKTCFVWGWNRKYEELFNTYNIDKYYLIDNDEFDDVMEKLDKRIDGTVLESTNQHIYTKVNHSFKQLLDTINS